MTADGTLELLSTSRATDGAWLAAADIAAIAGDLGAEYRLIGGNAVTLLTHFHGVAGRVPERETADADMGVGMQVCGDPALLAALLDRSYVRPDGSRFLRKDGEHELAIDVLAPSYDGTMVSNQEAGDMVVDAVPGLGLALAMPAVRLDVAVTLSGGRRIAFQLSLPDVRAALALKAYAYRGRLADKDAVDIWRLLEAAHAAGYGRDEWPKGVEARDGGAYLKSYFGVAGSRGPSRASSDRGTQARIRALVSALVP